jgi:hypothetical protein
MQTVFKNAIYHREPTVLRRRLLPLCLGHVYALMAAESPYVCGGNKSIVDLAVAVMVCSRTWEAGQEWFRAPGINRKCRAWGRTCRKLSFVAEHQRFTEYLDTYTQFPERRADPTAKPARHPWPLLLATQLTAAVGESRAWNMPLPLAVSYWSANAELAGDDTLVSVSDDDLLKEQIAWRAQQKREWEAKQGAA